MSKDKLTHISNSMILQTNAQQCLERAKAELECYLQTFWGQVKSDSFCKKYRIVRDIIITIEGELQ